MRTLVSKKLRALMDLVPIKAPATRVALPRKAAEFVNTLFWIVAARQLLQVVANQLIQAFPERLRPLASPRGELFVDREGNIHLHSICAHVLCVNSHYASAESSMTSDACDTPAILFPSRTLPFG